MARELLAELIAGLLVRGDGEADRRGRVGIGGGAHLAAIALAQESREMLGETSKLR